LKQNHKPLDKKESLSWTQRPDTLGIFMRHVSVFNEKIFLFLYWWLIFVAFISFFDIIRWTWDLRFETRRFHYVQK
jgi:hypothetical protein